LRQFQITALQQSPSAIVNSNKDVFLPLCLLSVIKEGQQAQPADSGPEAGNQ
jgi:hypothetical protein